MSDTNVVLICAAADHTAAEALASTFPGGSGTFSIPLSTVQGFTDPAQATHFAGSGYVSQEMADAFNTSVDPMYKVFPLDGTDFETIIANCAPPLYRITQSGGL